MAAIVSESRPHESCATCRMCRCQWPQSRTVQIDLATGLLHRGAAGALAASAMRARRTWCRSCSWCTASACRRGSSAARGSTGCSPATCRRDAHPSFAERARPARLGARAHPPRRGAGAVRALRRARLACRDVRVPRPRRLQRLLDRGGAGGHRRPSPYTDAQYAALASLPRRSSAATRRWPREHIVGHSDVAPGRKTDPGDELRLGPAARGAGRAPACAA